MTFSTTTFFVRTLSITLLYYYITILHYYIIVHMQHYYAECCAEYHFPILVMASLALSVITPSIILLNVTMQNVRAWHYDIYYNNILCKSTQNNNTQNKDNFSAMLHHHTQSCHAEYHFSECGYGEFCCTECLYAKNVIAPSKWFYDIKSSLRALNMTVLRIKIILLHLVVPCWV